MKSMLILLMIFFSASLAVDEPVITFKDLSPMPTARGAISSSADDKFIYVVNGFSAKVQYTSLVEKFDVANNSWSTLTTSLIPKQFPSSVVLDNKLYIFNGDRADGELNSKMEVIDLSNGTITLTPDNPQPAHAAGAVAWNGSIYFFGGRITSNKVSLKDASMSQYSDKLYRFEPATQKWTELSKMTEKKETRGVVVDGKLYVIGGWSGTVSNRIEVYDFAKDKWSKLTKMPFGISANSVAAYGNKIFTLFDYTNQSLVGCYDISKNTFTVLKPENLVARRHGGVHIINDQLYVVGGNTGTTANSSLSSVQVAEIKEIKF